MNKLYSKIEFDNSKSDQLLPLRCIECKKVFYLTKHYIQIARIGVEKRGRKYGAQFCSPQCRESNRHPPVIVICLQCGISFRKSPFQIKKHPNHFCCQSCAAKYNNTHKTKGTRVSKLEKWLQEKLSTIYSNLDIHFNCKDAINSELDIYIPSLKLAFELNGIFHYEPIYGRDKLNKTQLNDQNKFLKCGNKGISLCIIDTSCQKCFKEKSSQKYLDIIIKIIDEKIKIGTDEEGRTPVGC